VYEPQADHSAARKRRTPVAFNRVLVPLDGSELAEQAIPFAHAVTQDAGTMIYVQVVPEAEPLRSLTGGPVATADEVAAIFAESATGDLTKAADRWDGIAPNYEIAVGVGDPADTILSLADEHRAELIVIASHGRGALGRWTFGSVADRLARTSSLPVLVIRPRDAAPEIDTLPEFERILLLTDGSERSRSAIDEAADLAKKLGKPVTLVRSIFPEAELAPATGYGAVYAPELYEELTKSVEDDAVKSLEDIVEQVKSHGATAEYLLVHGPAAQTIQSLATPNDLIIMTSHGRSGFRRWLIGSVAEKLVRDAPCPVMLVRSDLQQQDA
jgi:nucleotide-binding universal stress UspA family protein